MMRSVLESKDFVLPDEWSIKEDSGVKGIEVVDDQQGVVRALVSVTGIKDRVNDIIHPGAYAETLTTRTPKGLVAHDWKVLVAKARDVQELLPGDENLPKTLPDGKPWPSGAGALLVEAQYNLDTPEGKTAYSNVKFFGKDQEWSIGYSIPAGGATKGADGVRHIKKLDLFEFSQVLWGAMPHARTVAVKVDGTTDVIEIKTDLTVREKDGSKRLDHPITMADGSYPIQDRNDLHNAIQAYGRSKDKPACKRHIIHVAGLLGLSDMIPEKWKEVDSTREKTDDKQDNTPLQGIELIVKAFQDMAAFLFGVGAISEELATKVAGPIGTKTHETMLDVADDLGAAVFDADALVQLKNLATVYDFALDQEIDTVIEAAESKVADFLADAIADESDPDRIAQIKQIAAAMLELQGPPELSSEGREVDDKSGGTNKVDDPDPGSEMVTINLDEFKV